MLKGRRIRVVLNRFHQKLHFCQKQRNVTLGSIVLLRRDAVMTDELQRLLQTSAGGRIVAIGGGWPWPCFDSAAAIAAAAAAAAAA